MEEHFLCQLEATLSSACESQARHHKAIKIQNPGSMEVSVSEEMWKREKGDTAETPKLIVLIFFRAEEEDRLIINE